MKLTAFRILILLPITFSPGAHQQKREHEIRSAYKQYYDGLRHRDVAAAMNVLDRGFTARLADGRIHDFVAREESLKELLSYGTSITDVTVDLEKIQTQPDGVTITIRCVVLITSESEGSPGSEAKPDSFIDDHIRDTWTHTSNGWRLKSSVYLRNTINGSLKAPEPSLRSAQLATLIKEWKAGNKAALADFWKRVVGKTPLIEEVDGDKENAFVTFIWRETADPGKVVLVGGLPKEDEKPLVRLADTDLWYRTELMPMDSRGTYGFRVDGTISRSDLGNFTATVPDPLNPRAFGSGSILELPNAPAQPYIREQPNNAKGILTKLKLRSELLKEDREYGVYTPPGFDPKGAAYPLLVLFDGETYGTSPDYLISAPTIVDNLIAQKKIPPIVMLLVDSLSGRQRTRDLTCSCEPFSDFLVKELIPGVRRNYNVTADPAWTIVGGSSFGGLESACLGMSHPETFGNVLSMSGSFWYVPGWQKVWTASRHLLGTGWVIQEYARRPRLQVRFYMEIGRFDGTATMLGTNRHLRDVLKAKGYPVTYLEFDGGHDKLCWRGSLANGLISLLNGGK